MSQEDDLFTNEAKINRALDFGNVWLNGVFRFSNPVRRLFGNKGPRVSKLEVVWSIICGVLTALILTAGYMLIGDWGPFFILWSPFTILLWSAVAVWQGRRVAHMSPLRSRTNEGTGVWLLIMFKRVITRISFWFARPVQYNQCITNTGYENNDGEPKVVECIQWIGTAKCPRAPYNSDPLSTSKFISLIPRVHNDYVSSIERDYAVFALKPRGVRVAVPQRKTSSIDKWMDKK